MNTLTERRKADRTIMVEQLTALAIACKATTQTLPEGRCYLGKRATIVEINAPGGLTVSIDFNGESTQPDVHVVSWYIPVENKRLSKEFEFLCGSVNAFHRHKATTVCRGFDALCLHINAALKCVQSGVAYE